MLRFFRNFSLNMLIVVMLIKKKVYLKVESPMYLWKLQKQTTIKETRKM